MEVGEETDWANIDEVMADIVRTSSELFEPATISNARDLIAHLRPRFAPPSMGRGYWPTFQIWWPHVLDIEVFDDRLEIYPPASSGKPVPVWYEPHTPGEGLSAAFVAEIDDRVPLNRSLV